MVAERVRCAAAALLALAAPAAAQTTPPPRPANGALIPEGERAASEARFARWRLNVPAGTGPQRVVRLEEPTLPGYTVYRPASLAGRRWPVVAFANGGCRNTSIEFAGFLAEIASHGYVVVAIGSDTVPFDLTMAGGNGPDGRPLERREPALLTQAVDWATAQNARRGGGYAGRLSGAIALMGQSCGGVQALSASADPRIATTVVLNSGYFDRPPAPGVALPARLPWSSFHAPVAFFTGGPSDVAYRNAEANFRDGAGVPMFKASLPVGHTGAYPAPDLRWTHAVIGWLDWRLKHDARAATLFVGTECGLCRDAAWADVAAHGLD